MSRASQALAAAAGTGIIVGAGVVATRGLIDQVGPFTIGFLRYGIALIIVLPILLRQGWVTVRPRDLGPVALLGIGQFAVLISLMNYAVTEIEAGLAALIFATFPLMTLAIAGALGREPVTLRRMAGITISIAGVGASVGAVALAGEIGFAQALAIGAAGLSALCGAVCSVFYRDYLQRYPTLQVSVLSMAAAVAFLAPLVWWEGFQHSWVRVDATGWMLVLFLGLSSAVGYFFWLFALRHTWPSNVTAFLSLGPVTASLLGVWLLGENFGAGDALGLTLVVGGLLITLWRSGEPRPVARA